jgi:lia operon protein LiaG
MPATEQWGEDDHLPSKSSKIGKSFLFWRKERVDHFATPAAEGIRSVFVAVESANITAIHSVSGSSIGIRLTGWTRQHVAEEFGIETRREGDQLHIGVREPDGLGRLMNWSQLELAIELPAKEWELIRLMTGSGDVRLTQLSAKSAVIESGSGDLLAADLKLNHFLRMHTGSGDVKAERIDAEESTVHSNSGDLATADMRLAQLLDLHTSSGNIAAERFEAERSTIYSGSGNIVLKDGAAAVKAESGSGNIHIERMLVTANSELWTGSGNVTVALAPGNTDLEVVCGTGSGNGSIRGNGFIFSEKTKDFSRMAGQFGDGSIKLQIRTGSGDYRIHRN